MKILSILLLPLVLLTSCRQVVDAVNMKQLAPEVVEYGKSPGGWYMYMPQYAPGFCLKTRWNIVWKDRDMQLGYWLLRHPLPPHRVMMEAHGDTLYLHRGFVWDGVSFGNTKANELIPSLLHDALYYARQGGAPISRREADSAYFRAARKYACSSRFTDYLGVRAFGGFFEKVPGTQPPQVELRSADSPHAPLPQGETIFNSLQR